MEELSIWNIAIDDFYRVRTILFVISISGFASENVLVIFKGGQVFYYLYIPESTIFTPISSSRHTEFAVAFNYYVPTYLYHPQQLNHRCHS